GACKQRTQVARVVHERVDLLGRVLRVIPRLLSRVASLLHAVSDALTGIPARSLGTLQLTLETLQGRDLTLDLLVRSDVRALAGRDVGALAVGELRTPLDLGPHTQRGDSVRNELVDAATSVRDIEVEPVGLVERGDQLLTQEVEFRPRR